MRLLTAAFVSRALLLERRARHEVSRLVCLCPKLLSPTCTQHMVEDGWYPTDASAGVPHRNGMSQMSSQTFSELAYFVGGYLHQDFDLHGTDVATVLDGFRSAEDPTTVRLVAEDAERLLACIDDETRLAQVLDSMGSEYDPRAEGLSHRELIAKIAQLGDGLSPKPSP
jgi:hypothetical protein